MTNKSLYLVWVVSLVSTHMSGIINFRSKSSAIQVDGGSGLVLDNQINDCRGQIIKQIGSTHSGQDIIFNNGTLEENGNRMRIRGRLKPDAIKQIVLSGNELFKGKGASVIQSLLVSGDNNRLEGDLLLANDIQLLDSNTGVTCALLRSLSKSIQLNGGKVTLEEDIYFVEDKYMEGNGTIVANNRSIILGTRSHDWTGSVLFDNINDLELKALLGLAQTWTFSGENCTIQGNGNFLSFKPHGKIVIDRGSTLRLKNVIIHQTTDDDITCVDDSGKVIFENVILVLDSEYNFDKGAFQVFGRFDIIGSTTFAVSTQTTCTINEDSSIFVGDNMVLMYDSPVNNKNNLHFAGVNSSLYFKNSTLHVTSTGLNLRNGNIIAEGAAKLLVDITFDADGLIQDDQGISLGDGITGTNDTRIQLLPGSSLSLQTGALSYNNVQAKSIIMNNVLSSLVLRNQGVLVLNKPLDVTGGRLQIEKGASLLNFSGSPIQGSVEVLDN